MQRRPDGEFVLVDYSDAAQSSSQGKVGTRWEGLQGVL